MKIERPNSSDLTPEELTQLEKLKTLIQQAMADGKFSQGEIQRVREFIHADRKVTFEELQTIRTTVREVLGDIPPEYDWD